MRAFELEAAKDFIPSAMIHSRYDLSVLVGVRVIPPRNAGDGRQKQGRMRVEDYMKNRNNGSDGKVRRDQTMYDFSGMDD
ncbi:hypothetical protein AAMO2058_000033800 [Amorphochlora amoebiformis]